MIQVNNLNEIEITLRTSAFDILIKKYVMNLLHNIDNINNLKLECEEMNNILSELVNT